MQKHTLRLGLVINPYAGLGGPLAQKGSDDIALVQQAASECWALSAVSRAQVFLKTLFQLLATSDASNNNTIVDWVSVEGDMGGACLQLQGFTYSSVEYSASSPSTAEDTCAAVKKVAAEGVDLFIFVGGDGTARDVLSALPPGQPALGVPAGVKMQSGVYAISPSSAAELVAQMACGELVRIAEQEVRDIDEVAFREGVVKSQYYGVMTTPDAPQFVQHVKQGGVEVEELVILDIAEHLRNVLPDDALLIVGPGSTTHNVMAEWGIEATLLGVDVVRNGQCIAKDVDAKQLDECVFKYEQEVAAFDASVVCKPDKQPEVKLLVTAIGGQGHIVGRGNQQISPRILRRIGRENLHVIATKTKLKNLGGRPLLMDSGDSDLDNAWQGFIPVITGYEDEVMMRVGFKHVNTGSACE